MEFNQSKYKECEDAGFHEFGWNDQAGVCIDCGLIHDCTVEDEYEYTDSPFEGYRCTVCHHYADNDVTDEIEQANQDARETN